MFEVVLMTLSHISAVALAQGASPAVPAAGGVGTPDPGATGVISGFVAGGAKEPHFQPYIFWAYGGACLLLFLFTLWTYLEARKVSGRIEYLKGRFHEAHPGESEEGPE